MDLDNLTEEDCRLLEVISWENKMVKHFKGDLYLILDTNAQHTETNERMIYYKALYGECKSYVRPAKIFIEKCSEEQYEQYGQKYKYELIKIKSCKE